MSVDTLCATVPDTLDCVAGIGADGALPDVAHAREHFDCEDCQQSVPLVLRAFVVRTLAEDDNGRVLGTYRVWYEDENQFSVYGSLRSGRRTRDERTVCSNCRDEDYTYCSDEDGHYPTGDCVESSDGEWGTLRYAQSNWHFLEANECWYRDEDDYISARDEYEGNDDDDTSSGCYTYGTNILARHGWPRITSKNELCFGVELECEPKERDRSGQRAIVEALGGRDGNGRYILAEDGSLDYGVEVISLPYTLAEHSKGLWRDVTKAIADIAMSGSGTTNCGLHIHINRKPLSALTVGKMLVFINSERTASLVTTVAQRGGESWARRHPKKFSDGRKTYSDHYDALGLTEHGTLELRIFRGNLRPERILKAIEFAHAVAMFCQQSSMLDVENPKAFVGYIRANKKTYPNLVAFIQESQGYGRAAAERSTNGRIRSGSEA